MRESEIEAAVNAGLRESSRDWRDWQGLVAVGREQALAVAKRLNVPVEADEQPLPAELVLENPVEELAGLPHFPICEWTPGINRRLGIWLRAENSEALRVVKALVAAYNNRPCWQRGYPPVSGKYWLVKLYSTPTPMVDCWTGGGWAINPVGAVEAYMPLPKP